MKGICRLVEHAGSIYDHKKYKQIFYENDSYVMFNLYDENGDIFIATVSYLYSTASELMLKTGRP